VIDPFEEYVAVLKSCFDFEALANFGKRPGFSILFDGMHGAGGPFARRVLIEELGLPEVRHHCNAPTPLKCPTILTYLLHTELAIALRSKAGLWKKPPRSQSYVRVCACKENGTLIGWWNGTRRRLVRAPNSWCCQRWGWGQKSHCRCWHFCYAVG
jgi:hypothetical protein